MSKGQRNHDRQPAARVRGREDASQSRFDGQAPKSPSNRKPGGSGFIKSANRTAPQGGEGKAPFSREGQRRSPAGREGGEQRRFNQDGNRDPRQSFNREGGEQRRFNQDGNRDPRQSFNREGGEQRRFNQDGNRDPRQSFNREGGEQRRPRDGEPRQFNRDGNRDPRQSFNREGGEQRRARDGEPRQFNRDGNRDPRQSFNREGGEQRRVRDGEPRQFNREGGEPRRFNRDMAPKVPRAKKMIVREPNQKVQDQNRRLRETRLDTDNIESVRLQKALANSGCGSRREMEDWIEAGLVTINGKKATLGDRVGPQDRVVAKGHAIKLKWADRLPRVILYHKTEGEMVTRDDPEGRVTIFDRLPQAKSSRWIAVGRLDVNTSGLLILTTSGELANRMMHPSFEVEREYAVRVLGELETEQRKELTREIELEDGPARFERIVDQGGEGANHWYRVVIKEGRNREVRRMFEFFNLQVSRLMRVRFGNIALPPRLKRGQYYELNEVEVASVMKWAGLGIPGRGRN